MMRQEPNLPNMKTRTWGILVLLLSLPALVYAGDKNKYLTWDDWFSSLPSSDRRASWDDDIFWSCCDDFNDDSFTFKYNRVDGIFFGVKKLREVHRRRGAMQIYGGAGVGLKSGQFQYHAVVERSFFPIGGQFAIGGEFYDATYSEDGWVIPTWENTLGAILIREDFLDYYRREGAGGYISQHFTRKAKLKIGYLEEKHRMLENQTNWSLFGGSKKFRINPAIDELTLKGLYGKFQIDTRGSRSYSRQGWLLAMSGEYFTDKFEGDTNFERYILELRRYQPISRGENLNFRLRVGETVGIVPVQKHFDLGGISTLRAFKYKEFTGDRMILANLEYQIDWDRLDWALDLPIVNELNLILFADAGLAWFKAEKDFDELASRDFHSDIGIAFATSNGSFRLNIAKRTDRSKDAVRVTFRISRPF